MTRRAWVFIVLLAAGCATTTSISPTGGPDQPSATPVYFLFDGYPVEPGPWLVPVARPADTDLAGALEVLLDGVTAEEGAAGLSSAIPEGTRLLGVEVVDGVAEIDLDARFTSGGGSLSILARAAQVVHTATAIPDVDAVRFFVEGTPLVALGGEGLIVEGPQRRDDHAGLTAPVHLVTPAWGSDLRWPIDIEGTATVPEVHYVVVDPTGERVAVGIATTDPATGRFATSIPLVGLPGPGRGSIIVFAIGPDDRQVHVLQFPLSFGDLAREGSGALSP